jgi:hypothetical protein
MIPTPIIREDLRAPQTKEAPQKKKGKLSIIGSLMTIPFKFLVITMLQFNGKAPLF